MFPEADKTLGYSYHLKHCNSSKKVFWGTNSLRGLEQPLLQIQEGNNLYFYFDGFVRSNPRKQVTEHIPYC